MFPKDDFQRIPNDTYIDGEKYSLATGWHLTQLDSNEENLQRPEKNT